jgi:hypothetical protein
MKKLLFVLPIAVALVGVSFQMDANAQVKKTGKPAMVQKCEKNFEVMDANKDGSISKEEFMAKHKGANAEKLFEAKDANGDGSISKEEFCAKNAVKKTTKAKTKTAAPKAEPKEEAAPKTE